MNRRQMLKAVERTLGRARHHMENQTSDIPQADWPHLFDMHTKLMKNIDNWSEAKFGRWLGWIQACVVIGTHGEITVDDMKEINKECGEE